MKFGETPDFVKKYRSKWKNKFTWRRAYDKLASRRLRQMTRSSIAVQQNTEAAMKKSGTMTLRTASSPTSSVKNTGTKRKIYKTTLGMAPQHKPIKKANVSKMAEMKQAVHLFNRLSR